MTERALSIEWCVKNERFGTREAVEKAVDASAIRRRYACLDLCEICMRKPFAVIDNHVVTSDDATALRQALLCRRRA
ncbi:uncharacterized protein YuzB (UPF0349 family) [Alicyclobacillus sacchari]|uniref:Uncharacterized protein YuzB (UPF0349 family) n=1 Tax=Alicyclobacillus sacchari TaxID=392010 RepID=A0A4R8LR00_9BACL|nr:DUF1450 domain-containing protein [Alicyclobacillus sacchari]TDY49993.1 uncharacterized protein YuzB (UPF0349 family) [Alicyclobacillus sacchari]